MRSDPATRLRLDVAQPRPADPVRGEDYGGGCGRETCPCWAPWRICSEWMGIPGETGRWCPRCGWAEEFHPQPQDLDADRYRWGHT